MPRIPGLLAVAAALLAGCLGATPADPEPPPVAAEEGRFTGSLTPLSPRAEHGFSIVAGHPWLAVHVFEEVPQVPGAAIHLQVQGPGSARDLTGPDGSGLRWGAPDGGAWRLVLELEGPATRYIACWQATSTEAPEPSLDPFCG